MKYQQSTAALELLREIGNDYTALIAAVEDWWAAKDQWGVIRPEDLELRQAVEDICQIHLEGARWDAPEVRIRRLGDES